MNLQKNSNFWVKQKLISKEQQQEILKQENKRFLPFVLLSFLWIGIFCFFTGIISLFQEYWNVFSSSLKVTVFLFLSLLLFLIGYKAAQKRKKFLLEVILFVSFFMIGAGIGIFAQIFNFPIIHFNTLLLWAFFSFILVFFSKREFLFLLWIPLFLGGVIGSLKLELLLLFFEQSPIFSTILFESLLLIVILITKNFQHFIFKAIYKWGVLLYFIVLFLVSREFSSVYESLIIFLFFTLIMLAFSIKEQRIFLFHISIFFLICRLIYLYFELFENKHATGVLFFGIGVIIFFFGFIWLFMEKKISKKSRIILR